MLQHLPKSLPASEHSGTAFSGQKCPLQYCLFAGATPHYNALISGPPQWFGSPADVECQPPNPLDKPVLDQGTFQQLLAAAYILQEQNDCQLVKEAKADFLRTLSYEAAAENVHLIAPLSLPPEPLAEIELPLKSVVPMTQSEVDPLASLNDSLLHPEADTQVPVLAREVPEAATFKRPQLKPAQVKPLVQHAVPRATTGSRYRMVYRRISQTNELFWRAATVIAVAAVSVLLLGASIHRFSPLPAELALPSEAVQRQVPFRRAKRIGTVLPQSGGVSTKTVVMEPHAATGTGPAERTVVADNLAGTIATPASARNTIVNPNRVHSAYESEADIVAPNAV